MATFPIGTGQGFLSYPAGAGVLPGAHLHGAKMITAATKGASVVRVIPAALGGPGQGAMVGVGKGMVAKGVIAGGSVVGGKGISLGLGIGLGLWGPMILAGLGVAAAYALWKSQGAVEALNEEDAEIREALSNS